jgi:excisionase family DNA binding protein
MSATDQRIHKLFQHMRAAADLLEQILLSTSLPHGDERQQVAKNDRRAVEATEHPRQERLAYTLKEVQELVGISRSAIYLAFGEGDLRAVKSGRKTLILAKDLHVWLEKLPPKS